MKNFIWSDGHLGGSSEEREKRLGQCPWGTWSSATELLSRPRLTTQEILSFLAISVDTRSQGLPCQPPDLDETTPFRGRTKQLKRLIKSLPGGRARVDFDGRLVPVEGADHISVDTNNDNGQDLLNRNHQRIIDNPFNERNDGLMIQNNLLLGPILENFNDVDDDNNNQAQEAFLRQQHQDAAKTILRLLRTRYKDTQKQKLQLIDITTSSAPVRPRARLTFRRICCAVIAVVTAFVCIMIQSLPSDDLMQRQTDSVLYKIQKHNGLETMLTVNQSASDSDDEIVVAVDALLHRIAKVRLPMNHISRFGTLKKARYHNFLRFWRDCSDGVLQVPAVPLNMLHSSNDVTWHFSCPRSMTSSLCLSSGVANKNFSFTCPQQGPASNCFLGIHDGFITDQQVADAISLGKSSQSDHFDIHYDTGRLPRSIIDSLYELLTRVYHAPASIKPVAFRVYATAPRNGDTTYFTQTGEVSQHPLTRLLNRKYYLQWVGDHRPRSKPHFQFLNKWLATAALNRWMNLSQYLRRSATIQRQDYLHNLPIDHCRILSDIEVNEQFQIHSSIFLNDDFSGGAMLFVDDDKYESKPLDGFWWNQNWPFWSAFSRKIHRGIAIYGRTGRVVLSSGENPRCGLPVRKGIKAVLQIWWRCT